MTWALENLPLPARIRPETPLTEEELMRFCAANENLRVERDANGELIVMSPTGSEGGSVELDVGGELGAWALSDGRGKHFGPSSGFTLPDTSVRAADAAWISWRRWNALTEKDKKSFAHICPEFVVEVRSESDRLPELQTKMELWIANGAEVAWLIDPMQRQVTIYRLGDKPAVMEDPTSVQGTGPIAGFELVMRRIWG